MPCPIKEIGFISTHAACQIKLVDAAAADARLERAQQHVLARREVRPDALRVRWRLPDGCGPANSGMITVDHRENLDAADVAPLKLARCRTHIGKDAALAGRDDHQLEIFRTVRIDASGERRGQSISESPADTEP